MLDEFNKKTIPDSPEKTCLTVRELQCLEWISVGKTNFEITEILGLSEHVVNQYISIASSKLHASHRTHAVGIALRLGLIK